jgi:hypothetical protein
VFAEQRPEHLELLVGAPTAVITRPPDSTSSEAMALAVSTGGRYPRMSTVVPRRIRSVHAATKNRVPSGSSHAMSGGTGKDPSSLYGYDDSMAAGQATWSLTQAEWNPAASARRANSTSASRETRWPRCGRWMPQSMFTSCVFHSF